jgi:hypothetical protein
MSIRFEPEYDYDYMRRVTLEIAKEAVVAKLAHEANIAERIKRKRAKVVAAKKAAKKELDFNESLELLDTKTGHRHCRCCGLIGPNLANIRLDDIRSDWVCKTCRAVCKAHNHVKNKKQRCRLIKQRKISHPYDYLVACLKDTLPDHLHVQPGAVDIILAYITEPITTPSLRCACCEFNYPVFKFSDSQVKKHGSKCEPCAEHYKNGYHRKEVCPASLRDNGILLTVAKMYGKKWCTVSDGCTVID